MSRAIAITFLFAIALLASLGILMLASTGGYAHDLPQGEGIYYFAKSQGKFFLLGILILVVTSFLDYEFWTLKIFRIPLWGYLMAVTFILLMLCYVPEVGKAYYGSKRWVKLPLLPQFQPSELAKIVAVFFLAWWSTIFREHAKGFWSSLAFSFMPFAVIGVFLGLPILFEKDVGTTALIMSTCVAVMFFSGIRWVYVGVAVAIGVMALASVVISNPNRKARMEAYFAEKDGKDSKDGKNYQPYQAKIAFGSGGLVGKGFIQGTQGQNQFLPEKQTDFIWTMVGEELDFSARWFFWGFSMR